MVERHKLTGIEAMKQDYAYYTIGWVGVRVEGSMGPRLWIGEYRCKVRGAALKHKVRDAGLHVQALEFGVQD